MFIHDDFLLSTDAARRLYHEYAAEQPILDYHNHLPPREIAENRRFNNLAEIWLEGDHYKWRAMRANGVDERYVTGDADPHDKYMAWAKTVPQTLRNPLFHWTHLELKRHFDIDELFNEQTAERIWEKSSELLATDDLSVHGVLKKFNVKALCTTDDPTDDLSHHLAIAASDLETQVFPTFRPDKAIMVNQPKAFNGWIDKLSAASDTDIGSLAKFLDALRNRHDFFHQAGSRLSDCSLRFCYADFCDESTAAAIFEKARGGEPVVGGEYEQFAAFMMLFLGKLDAEKGWTRQLHLGPRRNNNTRKLRQIGPDAGFDSIGDWPQIDGLHRYLDRLDQEDALPKTIVYNNNPNDNFTMATMLGNFQDSSMPAKMQFGAGWWHLDQKEGIEWQLNTLSNVGLLSRFIGMLTDSRSFMSFPRHEYFRRVLCNLVGREMASGELPDDYELVGRMVRGICYENAREYLRLEI